jgi:hypothetical protein
MADVENSEPSQLRRTFRGQLRHMTLETRRKDGNEFVEAKKNGLVLGGYGRTKHPNTFAEEQAEIEKELARQRKIQADQERLDRERAELERKKREFDELPEERKLMYTMDQTLSAYHEANEFKQKELRDKLVKDLNGLAGLLEQHAEASCREEGANFMEQVWDGIGWFDPGKRREKRAKQEEKRRARVDEVRRGKAT